MANTEPLEYVITTDEIVYSDGGRECVYDIRRRTGSALYSTVMATCRNLTIAYSIATVLEAEAAREQEALDKTLGAETNG